MHPHAHAPKLLFRRRGIAAAFYLLKLACCRRPWCVVAVLFVPPAHAERLKDLASIQGVRDNPLIGYGLMVGLDGSGDQTMQTPFTTQSLNNMLQQLGITMPQGVNMQLKNVAAVMVTATLPPFARPGQAIDVTVSSMGNAKSLRGGTLLMTPLKGATARPMRWRRATWWSAARAHRPAAARCRSTS
jgi:flagellar basal body P-ring protein FlgI